MAVAPRLKALPKPQEQAFIDTIRKIREKRITRAEDIPALSKHLNDKAIALCTAIAEFDETGFWKAYDALSEEYPQMKEWKEFIATPAQIEELPDPRFILNDGKRLLKLSSIEDVYETPDAEYLINKILETATVGLLYGTSGTGKTFTVLHMALSVAHGIFWHGRKTKSGPVWFVNTEGARGLKKRLQAWYSEHSDLKPSPNFKIIPWSLDLKQYQEELENTLQEAEIKPILIVLDNFSMCADGIDQSKQDAVAPILRNLNNIAACYGCHVMIIHHTNKSGDFNGTMAFRNHVDAMIELKKEDDKDENSPILIVCEKVRDGEKFPPIRTQLKVINLYYDEDEIDYVTSCVTIACDAPEPEKATPDVLMRVMGILQAHGQLNTSQWAKECLDVHKISKSAFYRVKAQLDSMGYVTNVGGGIKGKKVFNSLSENGQAAIVKVVPVVSEYSQETTGKMQKSSPSSPTTL